MIGKTLWAIAEGYIPGQSTGEGPALESHETLCVLNPNERDASIELTLYFTDREPVGPYRLSVPARRTRHFRFNELKDPAPVPRDTDYASLLRSDLPVIVQHTRLDSRQPALALMTTMAFPGG
ncbi:sensory rhodopsin transducer [Crenalkalicoccus roseus]|uniref:sensory rhodopsin transducer n=1 Tax=Crenalkalicoccus roseus TaxID=1485588 RepID=UPI001080C637|nr:sensory rhodopsin transducer [Crenalkalicoccus roseus]